MTTWQDRKVELSRRRRRQKYSGLIVEVNQGDEEVGSVPTDAEGQYQLLLLAGEYTLKPTTVRARASWKAAAASDRCYPQHPRLPQEHTQEPLGGPIL